MNKDRRKQIDEVLARIANELTPLIDEITAEIEQIRDDEQDYFDNMPESFQQAEKGELAEAAISALEDALSEMEGLNVTGVIEMLETAKD